MDSETLANFPMSDGALTFKDFGSETLQANSQWAVENIIVNYYYSANKDFWQKIDMRQLRESDAYISKLKKLANNCFSVQAKA